MTSVGLYHLAWEVDTLSELQRIDELLREAGALIGASDHGTTKALYARDPDGLEFKVSWLVPEDNAPEFSGNDWSFALVNSRRLARFSRLRLPRP